MSRRRWSHDARLVAVERLAALGHPDGHGFDLEAVLARSESVLVLDRQARARTGDVSELPYIEVLRDIALGRADALSDVMADDGRIPGDDAPTLAELDDLLDAIARREQEDAA